MLELGENRKSAERTSPSTIKVADGNVVGIAISWAPENLT